MTFFFFSPLIKHSHVRSKILITKLKRDAFSPILQLGFSKRTNADHNNELSVSRRHVASSQDGRNHTTNNNNSNDNDVHFFAGHTR